MRRLALAALFALVALAALNACGNHEATPPAPPPPRARAPERPMPTVAPDAVAAVAVRGGWQVDEWSREDDELRADGWARDWTDATPDGTVHLLRTCTGTADAAAAAALLARFANVSTTGPSAPITLHLESGRTGHFHVAITRGDGTTRAPDAATAEQLVEPVRDLMRRVATTARTCTPESE